MHTLNELKKVCKFVKSIKPFKIVYLQPGLHDLHLSEGGNQNNGNPKQQKSSSGQIQNNIISFPARS